MTRAIARGAFGPIGLLALLSGIGHAARSERVERLLTEWRIEEAERELEPLKKAHPHDPEVAFSDGNLRFLHGDYAGAVERLKEAGESHLGRELATEVRELRELAQATEEATHGFTATSGTHFVIHHAPGKDALLAPYALDALERAFAALGEDFGDRPSEPVRVEIFPEVSDLAKVSTLTLKEIETSGTIALCKFNRIMIVSPRALVAGYPWLDTLTHEYTHFIVSRASHNTVPIWLHEGLAKFEERRWRAQNGEGSPLTPGMEHLLASAVGKRRLITFEQMHPSMAKLPSQEDTALAFAEVYMVVKYLTEQVGWNGIRKVIGEMRDGKSDQQAVAQVVGVPFDEFQARWRKWLESQKLKTRPSLLPTALKFKKGDRKESEANEDDPTRIPEERARKLARLGGMLRARHRLRAAAAEYEKAQALIGRENPQVASKLARTYLELGNAERAIATAQPIVALYPDQAGPLSTLGQSFIERGDLDKAESYLLGAMAINPFEPALHCGLERVYRAHKDPRADAEADACRTLPGP